MRPTDLRWSAANGRVRPSSVCVALAVPFARRSSAARRSCATGTSGPPSETIPEHPHPPETRWLPSLTEPRRARSSLMRRTGSRISCTGCYRSSRSTMTGDRGPRTEDRYRSRSSVFVLRIHRLAGDDGAHHADVFDRRRIDIVRIFLQDHQVRVFPRSD